jgi:hypothetical protein
MSPTDPVIFWPALALFAVVFFLPTILAVKQRHRHWPWILLCNVFGMSIVTWVIAWVLLKSENSFLSQANSPPPQGSHACPSCGRGLNLEDYLPNVPEIGCSYCHARFPRPPA